MTHFTFSCFIANVTLMVGVATSFTLPLKLRLLREQETEKHELAVSGLIGTAPDKYTLSLFPIKSI